MATGLAAELFRADAVASAFGHPPSSGSFASSVVNSLVRWPAPASVVPAAIPGVYVENNTNSCLHFSAGLADNKYRTRCGWHVGPDRVNVYCQVPATTPFHLVCGTCLPDTRDSLLQMELDIVSSEDEL